MIMRTLTRMTLCSVLIWYSPLMQLVAWLQSGLQEMRYLAWEHEMLNLLYPSHVGGFFLTAVLLLCFVHLVILSEVARAIFQLLIRVLVRLWKGYTSVMSGLSTLASYLDSVAAPTSVKETVVRVNLFGPEGTPEAMVPGSTFIDARPPECQIALYSGESLVGHAVRIGEYIVTPTHCTVFPDMSMRWAKGATVACCDAPQEWQEVSPDISAAKMARVHNAPAAGRVGAVGDGHALIASSLPHMASVGRLQPEGFNLVKFGGSTSKGHSGCAYMVGKTLVGIHQGSSAGANFGTSAAYVEFALQRLGTVNESSDFAFLEKLSDKQRSQLHFNETGDPDEVEVAYLGKYYRISRADRQRLERAERRAAAAEEQAQDERLFGEQGEIAEGHAQALRKELADLRRLLQKECAPPAVDPAVDPLPQYSFPENLLRGSGNSLPEPLTSCPAQCPCGPMRSRLVRTQVNTSGPQVPERQCLPPSAPILESEPQQERPDRRVPENGMPYGQCIGAGTPSITQFQTSTSPQLKETATSRASSVTSTMQLEQALAFSERIQRLENALDGMARNVQIILTSLSSSSSSKKSLNACSPEAARTTSGSSSKKSPTRKQKLNNSGSA
uniref:Serine protease n=1 Tax=Macrotermes natalensis sobeli-like virus 1 TaxID=3133513 RepID=A0AAT9JA61_9VIRU